MLQKSVKQLTTWVTTGRLPTITYMGFMFYTSQVVGYPIIYEGLVVCTIQTVVDSPT